MRCWGSCLKSERRIGLARTVTQGKARNRIPEMSFHEGIFFYFSGANVFLHCFGFLSTSIHFCAHSIKVRGHLSEVSSRLSPRECQGLTQVTRYGGLHKNSSHRLIHLNSQSPVSETFIGLEGLGVWPCQRKCVTVSRFSGLMLKLCPVWLTVSSSCLQIEELSAPSPAPCLPVCH